MLKPLPKTSKKGFVLEGKKAQFLLFHGYTGSPYDLKPIALDLHEHDFFISVPLLKGHGTSAKDLHGVTAEDWLDEAEAALKSLDQKRPIIVGGLSMGALLAILLATQSQNIQALLLFSPALSMGLTSDLTIAALKAGLLNKETSLKKMSGGSDVSDPKAKAKTPSYKEMPVDGLLEFERLRLFAINELKKLHCPIFMAFGSKDFTIDTFASHDMIITTTTAPVFSQFYDNSRHVITLDYDRDKISNDVFWFLNHYLETTT